MYNTDEAIKQTLKDIESMEAANAVLPAIKKVIQKWNGKVLNKRIEADLKALDLPGHIYFTNRYDSRYEICYSPKGYNNWYTILYTLKPTEKYYNQETSFIGPDKRVNAAKAFEQIESGRVERLKTITSYREHLQTWEVKKQQIDILKKQLNAIIDTIPYTMQDYFNMRLRRY